MHRRWRWRTASCVYLVDSGGAFLPMQDEVFPDRDHFGRIFYNQARMSGAGIPQIAAVLGLCTAGGAYVPAMSDEAVIVRNQGTIFLGGPPLVKAATGEVVTAEELGGGEVHSRVSGVTDHLAEDDAHALRIVRNIVATLPPRGPLPWQVEPAEEPKVDPAGLYGAVPVDSRTPYDAREIIARVVDASRFQEFKAEFGQTLVTGFARIHGHPVGIVANNGILFAESAQKGAHFIELCDQRGIPPLLPAEHLRLHGRQGLRGGRHRQARRQDGHRGGLHPGAEADRGRRRFVRRRQLLDVRPGVQPRFLWMWPNAKISVMGGEQAASVLATVKRDQLEGRGEQWSAEEEETFKDPIRAQYEQQGNAYYATARLWDDGVIDPMETRQVLGLALTACANALLGDAGFGVFRM